MSAVGMLHLLKVEPTLLPVAPQDPTGADIEHRRMDEVHSCLRCGGRAQIALVADTELGNRWLDMCHPCFAGLRKELDEAERS